mgnify:CR=1 FL=1
MSVSLWTSAANNIVFSGEALRQPPVINYILKGYHSLALQVGDIVEGKVTGIKPFGAFVSLPEGKTGLVHISEVSYEFVQDLSAVLSDGQTVSVKVLSIAPGQPHGERSGNGGDRRPAPRPKREEKPRVWQPKPAAPQGEMSFEDMMARYKTRSEEKIADLKRVTENHRGGYSRRRG